MIEDVRPVIAVPDLKRSAVYYRDVLGFEIREIGDDGWRFFIKDNCTIMAGDCPGTIPPHQLEDHSYFAYLVLSDIDTYYEQVVAAGADIIKKIRNEPWGMREFAVRTLDGHRIMFGSRL